MMRIENGRRNTLQGDVLRYLPKELLFETGAVTELADDELDQIDQLLRGRAFAANHRGQSKCRCCLCLLETKN